ncbi:hypothetical protein ACIHFE_03895 [Streptomyces sp. NPDC052396]|uniref:hypothetical protein n=1 Tax=Streptomyces sp. NPDC052396 TaxID=3365689 RepID=UPI0037D9473D
MTSPPPPPPSNPPQPPGGGGGFGPPQGFGPLPPEQPPFGAQPPAGPPYGPPGYGPYGPPPVPPAPSGGNGAKIAAIVVAVVLVVGLAVGWLILANSGGKDDKPVAHSSSSPSPVESASPNLDNRPPATPTPRDTPSTAPASPPPLITLKPGDCFDAPQLSPSLTQAEKRSCTGSHDGQVISNEQLEGALDNETQIKDKALALCKDVAEQRLKSIGDGRRYYYYALYPTRMAVLLRGERQVACAITLSDKPGGAKLDAPLPGQS